MGFLSSLKRLFFVSESVAKSTAKKATEATKDAGADIFEKGSDLFTKTKGNLGDNILDGAADFADKAKSAASGLGDKAKDIAGNVGEKLKESEMLNKAADFTEGVGKKVLDSDVVKGAGDLAENLGGKILDTGENLVNNAKNTAENVGKTILESDALKKAENLAENVGGTILGAGAGFTDRAKDLSQNLGETILDKGSSIADKAKAAINNPEESLDAIVERAKGLATDIEDHVKASGGTISDKVGYDELEKSTLEGTDDFFAKADKFAKGDYGAVKEGTIEIVDSQETIKPTEKKLFEGDIHGFDDADGDGDPLIDDAIIEE